MNCEPYVQLYREAVQGKVTYHLEVQSRFHPARYVRQVTHHEELADAQDSAYDIKNFWAKGRDVRIVKVTTRVHEEIVT